MIPTRTARRFVLGRPPEEPPSAAVEPTLHPSISPTVVHHLRAHGYLVLEPEELTAAIRHVIAATPSKDRTPNKLAAVVMRLLRRESGHV